MIGVLSTAFFTHFALAALGAICPNDTNRVVISACGNIPIAGVSTGTNNAFPEIREPTITGLAVGLTVTGQIPSEHAFSFNKRLEVTVNSQHDIALVDVAIVAERFIGARAIWKTESFKDLFVTFGAPQSIGMSSIVGLLAPLGRTEPEGRRVRLVPTSSAKLTLCAPIAPGLIETIGIGGVETLKPDVAYQKHGESMTRNIIAILWDITPEEILKFGEVLINAGMGRFKIPLNSPTPLSGIELLVKEFGDNYLIGAGAVLTAEQVTIDTYSRGTRTSHRSS